MTTYGVMQSLVLVGVLLACMTQLLRQLAPGFVRRVRGRVSLRLAGRGPLANRLARWLRPKAKIAAGCTQIGSSPGCSSCSLARVGTHPLDDGRA